MRIRTVLAGIAVVASLACNVKPATIETWHELGLRLDHPSTWIVKVDKMLADNPDARSVQLEGPNHGLLMLTILPAANHTTAADFAKRVAGSRAKAVGEKLKLGSVPIGGENGAPTVTPIRMRVGGRDVDGVEERFAVELLSVQVPHIGRTLALDVGGHHVLVTLQSPEKDWAGAQKDVQLMLDSLAAAP